MSLTFRRLTRHLQKHGSAVVLLLLAIGGAAVANLASPWPLQILIDNIIGDKPLFGQPLSGPQRQHWLLAVMASYLILMTVRGLLLWVKQLRLASLGESFQKELMERVFLHTARLPLAFFDRSRVGDLAGRITGDVEKIRTSYLEMFALVTGESLTLIGAFLVMLRVDWRLALVMLLSLLPLAFLFSTLPVRMGRAAQAVRSVDSKISSHIHETLSGIHVVKEFGRELRERDKLGDHADERARTLSQSTRLEGKFILGVEVISAISLSVTIGFGSWRVWQHTLTLGTMLVFVRYLTMLYAPVGRLSQLFAVFQKAVASALRIEELLGQEAEAYGRGESVPRPAATEQLLFRNVHFAYEGKPPVLDGVNFSVRHGERIGIIGETGSGKSTLLQLLERFYEPNEGVIEIGGIPAGKWDLTALRSYMAVVPQHPMLFSGTIADNIRYGATGAQRGEMEAAARNAGIHEAIVRFPQGYETQVGERGVTLSGGERQRVAIARALLTKAPIVLLDEPTSALDTETEARILQDLSQLFADRTVIMVTHSEQLLPLATRVLRLEGGRLSALAGGTHR